jgi:sugar phosphate isomerase/epimerase
VNAQTLGSNDLIASSYTLSGAAVFEPARFSFAQRVAAAAKAGFAAIGIAAEDYSASRERGITDAEMRRIVEDHGISAAEIEFLSGWWC